MENVRQDGLSNSRNGKGRHLVNNRKKVPVVLWVACSCGCCTHTNKSII